MKMRFKLVIIPILLSCITVNVSANEALLEYEDIKITDTDFQNLVHMIVPEKDRKQFLSNEKRILDILQDMFLTRLLAQKAINEGLDQEPSLKFKIANQTERTMMQAMLIHMVNALDQPDFSKQAYDYFQANQEQFAIPEQVRVSHILISSKGDRTKEDGLKLALEIQAKAMEENADFTALAKEFSDDQTVATNGGDMGFFEAKKMVKAFSDAAFAMQTPGEISSPVETKFGYHVILFKERKPAGKMEFLQVKDKLIAEATQKFKSRERRRILNDLRSMDGVKINSEAIHTFITKN